MAAETENQPQQQEERRIEFNFPLLTLRTKRFGPIFDRLGALKGSRYIGWLFLGLVPLVAGIALYLIITSLIGILLNPVVGQVVRELGPGTVLLLPGLNPLLPIVYGWLGIVVAIIIHEGAHGVIARSNGLNVKSSGLLFLLFIPIGAFVDVDEEQIKNAKPRASLKVMAAGVGGNIVLGAVCLLTMLVIVGSLTPIIDNGVYISSVTDGKPAQLAGLQANDVLVSIDNMTITNSTGLRAILDTKTAGDTVAVTVKRGTNWQYEFVTIVNLTVSDNRTVMGILGSDLMTQAALDNYKTFSIEQLALYMVPPTLASGVVPFSDSLAQFYISPLGPSWSIVANTLFWLWFVNFNLAIFNALPIYPLDGGRIFNITLKSLGKGLSEKAVSRITWAVTAVCIIIVVSGIVLPFIL